MAQPIREKLHGEIGNALRSAEIRDKIRGLDLNVFATGGAEIRPLILELDRHV